MSFEMLTFFKKHCSVPKFETTPREPLIEGPAGCEKDCQIFAHLNL
jgi:hypothetical protein